jgi:hypothetical protein
MVPVTRRRGAALLELVVALPLLLLVSALAVQGFVAQLQVVTAQESRLRNVRELEHAALALAADLRPLAAADVEGWSDTTVVALVPVLRGYICGTPAPHLIDVAIGDAGSAARAVVLANPRDGDRYSLSGPDTLVIGLVSTQLDAGTQHGLIRAADAVASACVDAPTRGTGAPWRLTLAAPLAATPTLGTFITVSRRTEWRAYRASDARYYLGRREWTGVGWSTIQPVAGPLLPPSRGGFVLRVLRADGSSATSAPTEARQVEIGMRAPRTGVRGSASLRPDSLRVRLALRGGAP